MMHNDAVGPVRLVEAAAAAMELQRATAVYNETHISSLRY